MKKYWLLFGFVFCISLLFAQNMANYDTKEYEPVKLKPFKTHPNIIVPEELELEPDTESAKIESKEISKPVITIKEEPKTIINQNVIQAQPKQEPKIDINTDAEKKINTSIQSEQTENDESRSSFIILPKGKSKAFKITPIEGVTISAEENALDKDREFTMKAVSEKQVDDYGNKLNTEKLETGCVVDAWELHAGLKDNEILPGSFKMEFDLEKIGVLPKFYENVACYRVDDKGNWLEYDIQRNGNKIWVESRQNSSIVLAVVDTFTLTINSEGEIGIRNSKNAEDNVKNMTYWPRDKWIITNPKQTDLKLWIIYDDLIEHPPIEFKNIKEIKPLVIDLFNIYYKTKNSYEIKKKAEEALSKTYGTPAYNRNNLNQIAEDYCLDELQNNTEYLNIARKVTEYYPEYLKIKEDIIKSIQKAFDYYCYNIFPKGLKKPTGKVKIKFDHTLSSSGVTGPVPDPETLNPYIRLSININGSQERYDNLTITFLHEFFHVVQRACYKTLGDKKWDEATAQFFQEEAYKWFIEKKIMTSTKFLEDEVYGAGRNYEYFAYPLDSTSGTIDGKSYSLSGQSLAEVGYAMFPFIYYVYTNKNQTVEVNNWGELLEGYFFCDGKFTSMFKYLFRNNKSEVKLLSDSDMTQLHYFFAIENSDKIYNRIINNKNNLTNQKARRFVGEMAEYYLGYGDEKKRLYYDTADLILSNGNDSITNGQHIELLNEDYTIRLREIHNYAKGNYKKKDGKPKEIAMQILFDDGLKDIIPDREFKPVGPDKATKIKKGWFYFPQTSTEMKKVNKLSKEDSEKFKKYRDELEKSMDFQKAQDLANKKFNRITDTYFQKDFYILEIDGGSTDSSTLEVKPTGQWGSYTLEEKEVKKSGYTIWTMLAPELEEKPFDFEMVEEIVNGKKEQVEKVRLQLPKKSEAALLGKCIDGYIVKINVDKGEKIERYFEMDKIKEQKVYFDFEELKPKDFEPNEPITGKVSVAEYVLSNNDKKLEGPESEEVEFVLNNSLIIEMVKCPAGSFMMGSSKDELRVIGMEKDEELLHKVTISKPFYIGKYEVTQEQYEKVMKINPSKNKCASAPVDMVTWEDAEKFCEVLNTKFAYTIPEKGYKYALPTEAQWEYACRAGTTSSLNSGKEILVDKAITKNVEIDEKLDKDLAKAGTSDKLIGIIGERKMDNTADLYKNLFNLKSDNLDEVAWYKQNSKRKTHPVGLKKPNAWGIYDMHGNAGEFCGDWYYEYTDKAVTDPVGKKSSDPKLQGRVIRGGSFAEIAMNCRSGFRAFIPENSPHPEFTAYVRKGIGLGFRVVLVPVE